MLKTTPRLGVYAAALSLAGMLLTPQSVSAQASISKSVRDHVAAGKRVALIVTTRPGLDASGEAAHHGGRIRRQLTAQSAAIDVEAAEVDQLAAEPGVEHISLDLEIRSTADAVATTVGADQVWAADRHVRGFTGRGIGVAVIDSGVHLHPDIKSRIAARLDFTGQGLEDGYGHGTHVAGMIAGSGAASGGQYSGVAPGANVVSLKVIDGTGAGRTSNVIAAIEWVLAHGR